MSKFNDAMEEAEKVAEGYTDYKVVGSNSIPYLDSIDSNFVDKVNAIKSEHMTFIIIFLAVFSLVFICSLFFGNISFCVLTGAILGIIIFLFVSARSSKPMIAKGKIVSKKKIRYMKHPRKNYYYVSVAFEANKTICHRVPIFSGDYENSEIGSDVVVVKYGSTIESFLVK